MKYCIFPLAFRENELSFNFFFDFFFQMFLSIIVILCLA